MAFFPAWRSSVTCDSSSFCSSRRPRSRAPNSTRWRCPRTAKSVVAGGDAKALYVCGRSPRTAWSAPSPSGESVLALAWAPDRRTIAAGTRHGCQIWRRAGADYQREAVFSNQTATALAAAIAPDGTDARLRGGGLRNFLFLRPRLQRAGRRTLFERSNLTSAMAYSPSRPRARQRRETLSVSGMSGPARVPKAPPARPSVEDAVAQVGASPALDGGRAPGFVEYAAGVAYDAAGKLLAGVNGTGGRGPRAGGKTLRVWEAKDRAHHCAPGYAAGMGCVVFLASGDLVTGSDDGKLRVWECRQRTCDPRMGGAQRGGPGACGYSEQPQLCLGGPG
jgi:hypothetical protein